MIDGVRFMEIPEVDALFDKRITNIALIRRSCGGREIYKGIYNEHQVILKNVKDSNRAQAEFNNQRKAFELLKPHGFKVPQAIDVKNSWIVSEFIEGNVNQLSYEELQKALRYLHVLHSSDYRTILPLNNHYYGKNLINRLNQENDFLSKAIRKYHQLSSFKKGFERILRIAVNYANHALNDSPAVVGHGDFQPKNIIVNESGIIPIDWIDFGRLLRWYDVGNLLFKQKRDGLLSLLEHYLRLGSKQSYISSKEAEKIIKNFLSVTFIIRTGSHFRYMVETNENPSGHFSKVEANINYIDEILESFRN